MATASRVRDDLRGLFRGALSFDDPTRAVYSTDAGPFGIVPHGVAAPLDTADLRTLVEYAQANSLPLVPRGAGTSPAGAALGPGLVVDLSVHFRSVLEIGPDWARVQAGVTLEELALALEAHGRRFAVESPTTPARTAGGFVATDGAGVNAHRAGYCRDHITALTAVLDSGEVAHLTPPGVGGGERGPRLIELRAQTAALLAEHRDLIQLTRPLTRFNRCGYNLAQGLAPGGLDLVRLFVGSEGTLGIVTEVTLATVPLPGGAAEVVIGFATVDTATQFGLSLWGFEPVVGCELFDQRSLALARSAIMAEGVGPLAPTVGAALVISLEADSPAHSLEAGREVVGRARAAGECALLAGPTSSPDGRARVRRVRRAAVGPLHAPTPGPRLVNGVEDIAVPAEELPRFLQQSRAILQKLGVTASLRVQVLAGMVHLRPLLDLADPADREKFWPLAEAVHNRALALGGTVSAAHATGLARTPWVEKQYGPLVPVFRELKRVYDPKNILNPGRGVESDPSRPAWPLRPAPDPARVPLTLLSGKASDLTAQVANCNGCGDCRVLTGGRMCPVFRADRAEPSAPRSKAVLLRAALDSPDPPRLDSAEARAVAATCVHCKMCLSDCPGQVDIPRLAVEIKAQAHAENGLDRADWVMARIESFAWLMSRGSLTSNLLLRLAPARWLAEKLLGVSRKRILPRVTPRTYLWRAWRQGLSRRPPVDSGEPRPRVAYFVDHFANYHDVSIAQATVAVLRHHDIEVHVPWRQRACGLAPLVEGDVETAREIADRNVRTLAALVRDGYTVVCSEPTAALTLTDDYLTLLNTPDAKLVAANTVELTQYLLALHRAGELRTDFQRLDANLGHHVPCHVKALGGSPAGPELLKLIPGVQVYEIDAGCSGMAGTWGLRASAYDRSRRAGAALFAELAKPRVMYGSTECSACRLQMHDGGGKRTLHPVQYLALAYGLMPGLAARLARPLGRRVD